MVEIGGSGGGEDTPIISDDLRAVIVEEVTRAVQVVIPTIVGAVQESFQKRANEDFHQHQDGNSGGDRGDRPRGCTYKEFLNCKPNEFKGTDDPVEAVTWIKHVEKMFRTSKCADEDKVEYATNLLQKRAQDWWEVCANALGEETLKRLTWGEFKTKFNEEYCSEVAMRQMEESFMQLKQGSKTVMEYTGEFTEKARFAEHQVNTEKRKIDRFLWGLRADIREIVKATDLASFRKVVDKAVDRENELKRQKEEKETVTVEKRKWEGTMEQSSKKRDVGKPSTRKE